MARTKNKYVSQATRNALLRYEPQRQAIADLQREAEEQFSGSVAGAESTGRLTSAAIEQAKPQLSGIYDRAASSTSSTQATLAAALAALGGRADGFKAAAATESAAGNDRLTRERAAAEGALTQQDVSAKSAPSYARTLAGQQLLKTLGKLAGEKQSIAGQEGSALASELGTLENQAEGRRVTERGQDLSAASSAASRTQKAQEHKENLEAKNGTAAKPRLLPQATLAKAATTLRQIEGEARQLRDSGLDRKTIYGELTTAHPAYNEPKRDANGNVLRTKTAGGGVVSGAKKIKEAEEKGEVEYEKAPALDAHDALLAQAALDSVYGYGRVSRGTLQRLHNAGYSIKALQLQGPGPVKPQKPKKLGQRTQEALGF